MNLNVFPSLRIGYALENIDRAMGIANPDYFRYFYANSMKPGLIEKLERIRKNPASREFILADARDADMAWGVPSPGKIYPPPASGERFRTMPEFHEQIRAIARQGIVDIMLASISTMSLLAHRERLFDGSEVTPAVRINDTSDVWCPRGGRYREYPSLPFASGFIEEVQYGTVEPVRRDAPRAPELGVDESGAHGVTRPAFSAHTEPVVNLGLYSVTFNNQPLADRESLQAFKDFRAEAQRKGFHYFLEVFAPNVDAGLRPEEIPAFVNDNVCRMLAGVPLAARVPQNSLLRSARPGGTGRVRSVGNRRRARRWQRHNLRRVQITGRCANPRRARGVVRTQNQGSRGSAGLHRFPAPRREWRDYCRRSGEGVSRRVAVQTHPAAASVGRRFEINRGGLKLR
jgi:hypothetical protein